MNNSQRRSSALTVILLLNLAALHAQLNVPKYELGASFGNYIYQGDLSPGQIGSYKTMRWGLTLHASKLMSSSFSLRANVAIGGLRGDDGKFSDPEYRQQRNFNFRSPVLELTGLLVWNPLRRNYEDKGFSPYLFTGAGIGFLKIRRDWSNYNSEYFDEEITARLNEDAQHTPPRVIPVIPVGAGIRYGISYRLAVNLESSYRFVFTDYLDGFSKSVNPEKDDHYHTTSVGLIYRIGKKNLMNCPVIRY